MTEVAPNEIEIMPAATAAAIAANAPKLVPFLLKRHYHPIGEYEIVGYHKPAVMKKNAAGATVVEEPAEFVAGEMMPAPHNGVGFETKIWAGTVIKLPRDEAKAARAKGIGEYEIDD